MTDWFRNETWSDEIEAAFEAKLSRARDKGQYLKVQGYALLAANPAVAAHLLERCSDIGDHWKAESLLYLGQARLRLGDVDGAIDALKAAIEQEKQVSWARTGARSDLALIIACYHLAERYDEVMPYLATANVDLATASAEDLAAEAIILADIGELDRARVVASEALRWLEGLTEGAADPWRGIGPGPDLSPAGLISRLQSIAGLTPPA